MRAFDILVFAVAIGGFVAIVDWNKFRSPGAELIAQQQEEQRLQDQNERAALAEQMRAAAIAEEQKREPIRKLQSQIDALDQQVHDARSKGKDWAPLEKEQEALEARKRELERQ